MKNKTILIIPDIHHKWKIAEEIISLHNPDEVIFLGDYFDDFGDTPKIAGMTAEWLKESLSKPNRIHLWGNHDLPYAFPSKYTFCAGYDSFKAVEIKKVLTLFDFDNLRFHYWINDYLLTHAGLHPHYLQGVPNIKSAQNIKEYLAIQEDKANMAIRSSNPHWFINCGVARYGRSPIGGLVWCDATDEFKPIKYISQIFGHTIFWDKPFVWMNTYKNNLTTNICLNTNLRHYILFTGDELTIEEYKPSKV